MTKTTGKTFKSIRRRLGLTQSEMAKILALPNDIIRNIEAGTEIASSLHRYALLGLHFERSQKDATCVTAKMLASAQAILKQAGHEVIARSTNSADAGQHDQGSTNFRSRAT